MLNVYKKSDLTDYFIKVKDRLSLKLALPKIKNVDYDFEWSIQ